MRTRLWMATCMIVMVVFGGSAALAQNRGQDNQNRDDRNRQQNGNYNGNNNGNNGNNQDRRDQYRFNDHDRQVSRDWYNEHPNHTDRGFRDRDRLTPQYESQLREGVVLNRDLRRRTYSAPYDLRRRLPPAPRGYRYVVVGGHVVLVDNGYRIHDVLHLELNF
jgi:Ni/Co efflux regulator RcnB